jgi:hypothetical protein
MRTMPSIPVQSTTLTAVAYDRCHDLLELHFRGGAVYHYFRVPANTYRELLEADSKGGYFNRKIRGLFPYTALRSAH